MRDFFRAFAADARFYCDIKHSRAPSAFVSLVSIAFSSPGFWVLTFHRIIFYTTMHRNLRRLGWWVARITEVPCHYLNNAIFKSDLLGDCFVDGPIYLPDKGYLTCGAQSVGAGTVIHDHVTFGLAVGRGRAGRPQIGRNVWIGNNSIIAGGIEIGDGSTILPDTYLSFSVPARSVVRGNPARVIREDFDNSGLRQTVSITEALTAQGLME